MVLLRRKLGLLAFCLGLATSGSSDRLIRIPTGSLLYPARLKTAFDFQVGATSNRRYDFNVRVNDYLELESNTIDFAGAKNFTALNVQANLYPEIPGYAPGVSIGVRDLTNRTGDGIAYYAAISYRVPMLGEQPLDRDLILHLGLGMRGIRGLFLGVEMPLSNHLLILAEHDSHRINAALVLEPTEQLQIRLTSLDGQTFWGMVIRSGF